MLEYLNIEEVFDTLLQELHFYKSTFLTKIKKTGDNIMFSCPYHGNGMEQHPSMGILLDSKGKQDAGVCHCFTCNKTVDLTELISYVFGYDDKGHYGMIWLSKHFMFTQEERPVINILKENKPDLPITYCDLPTDTDYNVNNNWYLLNRGLNAAILEYFKISYDHINEVVCFPVYNIDSKCIMVQKRCTKIKMFINDNDGRKGTTLYAIDKVNEHLNNPQLSLMDTSCVYVVESIIDALYLWSYGKLAVAMMQAVPTPQQLDLIKNLPVNHIIVATDNDKAGKIGANMLNQKIKYKLVTRFIFPKGCKDINDLTPAQLLTCENSMLFN